MQNIHGLCALSLNVVNEKLFLIIWAWFTIVATVTTFNLLHKTLSILFQGTCKCFQNVSGREYKNIYTRLTLPQSFILHLIGKNINTHILTALLTDIKEGHTKLEPIDLETLTARIEEEERKVRTV